MENRNYQVIPGENKVLISLVGSWLNEHNNKIESDSSQSGTLELKGFINEYKTRITFSIYLHNLHLLMAMEYPLNESSVSTLENQFKWLRIFKFPLPEVEVPPTWAVYLHTPVVALKKDVTFNSYDPTSHTLDITINIPFKCAFGHMTGGGIGERFPKGSYFKISRSIEGHIRLLAQLNWWHLD